MKIVAPGRDRPRHHWGGFVSVLAAGASLSVGACAPGPGVATPIPEPPTLQLGRIGPPAKGVVEVAVGTGMGRHIYGLPGAAPAGAVVRVTNLDRSDPVAVSNVAADGSFELTVVVDNGEELRFDWLRGGERGEPEDARCILAGGASATVVNLAPSERFACLKLTPGFALDFTTSNAQTLTVLNECSSPIALIMPSTRLGLADFQLQTPLPGSLATHQSLTLGVTFARTQPSIREDTQFFVVTAGAGTIRYPVTLSAPAQ